MVISEFELVCEDVTGCVDLSVMVPESLNGVGWTEHPFDGLRCDISQNSISTTTPTSVGNPSGPRVDLPRSRTVRQSNKAVRRERDPPPTSSM